MTRNVTPTHCHFIKISDQFFVLNRFGGHSVFCQMYQLKLINRQIWESVCNHLLTTGAWWLDTLIIAQAPARVIIKLEWSVISTGG